MYCISIACYKSFVSNFNTLAKFDHQAQRTLCKGYKLFNEILRFVLQTITVKGRLLTCYARLLKLEIFDMMYNISRSKKLMPKFTQVDVVKSSSFYRAVEQYIRTRNRKSS